MTTSGRLTKFTTIGTIERRNIRIDKGEFLLSAYARNAENATGIYQKLRVCASDLRLTAPGEGSEHLQYKQGRHLPRTPGQIARKVIMDI